MTVAAASPSRPIHAVARRQAWRELPVRIAALVAAGVVAVVIVVGGRAIADGLHDRHLLANGAHVTATLIGMENGARHPRSQASRGKLSFRLPTDTPDQPEHIVEGDLTPVLTGGDWISVAGVGQERSKLPIVVDPENPIDWTDRLDPPSWTRALSVPMTLTPVALLAIGLMLWQRARVLKLYRTGLQTTANVVELKKSALLPSARVMKVAPHTAGGRVVTVVRPNRLGDPLPAGGETVDVIVDNAARPGRALLAGAYEDHA